MTRCASCGHAEFLHREPTRILRACSGGESCRCQGYMPPEQQHDERPERCPICGGLNPGDITHTRCA